MRGVLTRLVVEGRSANPTNWPVVLLVEGGDRRLQVHAALNHAYCVPVGLSRRLVVLAAAHTASPQHPPAVLLAHNAVACHDASRLRSVQVGAACSAVAACACRRALGSILCCALDFGLRINCHVGCAACTFAAGDACQTVASLAACAESWRLRSRRLAALVLLGL